MNWKEYKGRPDPRQGSPEGYEPTMLEEGKEYLLFTETGETKLKKWYYVGGFRTKKCEPMGAIKEVHDGEESWWFHCDINVLYYAEITTPKGFVNKYKLAEANKLKEKIKKMQKRLNQLEAEV